MPGEIQRVPQGLLSLLGVKGTGQNPRLFGDVVSPTLELLPFLIAPTLTAAETITAAVAAAGSGATVTVPAREAWVLVAISARLDTGTVAGLAGAFIGLQSNDGSPAVVVANSGPVQTIANANQRFDFGIAMPQPMLLAPGSSVFAGLTIPPTTGTLRVTCRALYYKLLA